MVVNGMCSSATMKDTKSAPIMASAPCAKLTVCVALKIRTNPRAMMAYTAPRPSDFIRVWKNSAGSLNSCSTRNTAVGTTIARNISRGDHARPVEPTAERRAHGRHAEIVSARSV